MLLNPNTGDPDIDVANREAAEMLVQYIRGDDAATVRRLTEAGLNPEHLVRISVALLAAVRELLLVACRSHPASIDLYIADLTDRFGLDK